jgi:hypothetical protein
MDVSKNSYMASMIQLLNGLIPKADNNRTISADH